jgi:hypothetical protein
LLYTKFRGNGATHYGQISEIRAKEQYQTYQQQHGHPGLKVDDCMWSFVPIKDLGASPDGLVVGPSDTAHPMGLVEI